MRKILIVLVALMVLAPAAFAAKTHKAVIPVKTHKAAAPAKTDAPAPAGSPVLIDTFGNWKTYSFTDDTGKVCFMSTKPKKQEGKFKRRGDVLFFITHWAGSKTKNVVSAAAGYTYKENSKVTVKIDGRAFDLTPVDETAWARDSKTDDAIAEAVRKGSALVVTAASKHDTKTKDTYSLKGSAEAYSAITKACGL